MDLQISQMMPQGGQRGGRNQSNYGDQGYQGNRQQGNQFQGNNYGGNQNYQNFPPRGNRNYQQQDYSNQ